MKNINFTDLELMKTIQNMYKDDYLNRGNRKERFYIPISCDDIAKKMKVPDKDLVFQRLYTHLEKRYAYKNRDGSNVHFFAFKVGQLNRCINYPYLCAIVAQLKDEEKKLRFTQIIAVVSLLISFISATISIL